MFLSTGIIQFAFFQFITVGSLRTPAVLHIELVKISLWITVHTACKTPILSVTPSVVVWLTRGMTTWIISGISLFVINLCAELLLVVSVSVIFMLFPSLA